MRMDPLSRPSVVNWPSRTRWSSPANPLVAELSTYHPPPVPSLMRMSSPASKATVQLGEMPETVAAFSSPAMASAWASMPTVTQLSYARSGATESKASVTDEGVAPPSGLCQKVPVVLISSSVPAKPVTALTKSSAAEVVAYRR